MYINTYIYIYVIAGTLINKERNPILSDFPSKSCLCRMITEGRADGGAGGQWAGGWAKGRRMRGRAGERTCGRAGGREDGSDDRNWLCGFG